jgi:hypothetical protein
MAYSHIGWGSPLHNWYACWVPQGDQRPRLTTLKGFYLIGNAGLRALSTMDPLLSLQAVACSTVLLLLPPQGCPSCQHPLHG